jgi:hypothetical protein
VFIKTVTKLYVLLIIVDPVSKLEICVAFLNLLHVVSYLLNKSCLSRQFMAAYKRYLRCCLQGLSGNIVLAPSIPLPCFHVRNGVEPDIFANSRLIWVKLQVICGILKIPVEFYLGALG